MNQIPKAVFSKQGSAVLKSTSTTTAALRDALASARPNQRAALQRRVGRGVAVADRLRGLERRQHARHEPSQEERHDDELGPLVRREEATFGRHFDLRARLVEERQRRADEHADARGRER